MSVKELAHWLLSWLFGERIFTENQGKVGFKMRPFPNLFPKREFEVSLVVRPGRRVSERIMSGTPADAAVAFAEKHCPGAMVFLPMDLVQIDDGGRWYSVGVQGVGRPVFVRDQY